MRIAEYKQINTEVITNTVMVDDYNEEGELIGSHEEVITKEIPIYGMVYRDLTPEEEEEAKNLAESAPIPEPSVEDKVKELEEQNEMLTQCLLELASIIYA